MPDMSMLQPIRDGQTQTPGQDGQVQLQAPTQDPTFLQYLLQALRQGTIHPDSPDAPRREYNPSGLDVERGLPPIRENPRKEERLDPEVVRRLRKYNMTLGVRG